MKRSSVFHTSSQPDHFKTLEVPQVCNDEDVKKAYLRLAKQWHPDVNKTPEALEKFKVISEAYDSLKDEVRRSHYRAQLQSQAISDQFARNGSPYQSYYGSYESPESSRASFFQRFKNSYASSSASSGGGALRRGVSGFILFGGPLIGLGIVLTFILGQNKSKTTLNIDHTNVQTVEAWFNPKSKRWETPAPWNEDYKRIIENTPNKQIKRHLVVESRR